MILPIEDSCFQLSKSAINKSISTHYTTGDQILLQMLTQGTAGKGKSFLIQAIAQQLQTKCLLPPQE